MYKTIIFFIAYLTAFLSSASAKDTCAEGAKNIYELYRKKLDRGDTVKIRNHTSGGCHYESLTQIIKKNDSTLVVNIITTPCLKYSTDTDFPGMPPIEEFNYTPYSVEVPLQVQDIVFFNIQNATGRMRIINLKRDFTTKTAFIFTPVSVYNLNYLEFLECILFTADSDNNLSEKTLMKNALMSELGGNIQAGKNLFGDYYIKSFGTDPTFFVDHMWGMRITERFIVLIENVQNDLQINGSSEEKDFTNDFIKMAESIKPIDPNVFDLRDLKSYCD